MKYPNNKKSSRGVSIIEIVVSMVLLMTVMLSLAFVYPNGRRLTNSSDYRTKATEIARSILEETKLISFDSDGAHGQGGLSNIVLVRREGDAAHYIDLNHALANANALQWPYHHLSTVNSGTLAAPELGVTWDATIAADGNTMPICPFYITEDVPDHTVVENHRNRPFFLISGDTPSNFSRSINVSNTTVERPPMAVIDVTVYWAERVKHLNGKSGEHISINSITLTDARTYNVY